MEYNIQNINCNNCIADEEMPSRIEEMVLGGIKKIMAGVHDCIEAFGDDDDEPIILAAVPGEGIRIVDLDGAYRILPCFGLYASEEETEIPEVSIAYDPDHLLTIGDEDYVVGPVILFCYDEDGEYASVTIQDAYDAQEMIEEMTVTLCGDGKDFPAFRLD